ncbi:hypothetical protein CALCODRAFT_35247 [Calocera cornea HHB12733]|uniref:Uncharacterized protein n=1 Tax=Calocera cornea HHB12733 TaxID=1353952 RepID=A0A165E0G7_9BASI|nr:hypothetical protein CALCODRAFT_35247 [Calocera cornea HHB12733]
MPRSPRSTDKGTRSSSSTSTSTTTTMSAAVAGHSNSYSVPCRLRSQSRAETVLTPTERVSAPPAVQPSGRQLTALVHMQMLRTRVRRILFFPVTSGRQRRTSNAFWMNTHKVHSTCLSLGATAAASCRHRSERRSLETAQASAFHTFHHLIS